MMKSKKLLKINQKPEIFMTHVGGGLAPLWIEKLSRVIKQNSQYSGISTRPLFLATYSLFERSP